MARTVTIYNDANAISNDLVHTWLILDDGAGTQYVVSYGPKDPWNVFDAPGSFNSCEDINRATSSVEIAVSSSQFEAMLNQYLNYLTNPPQYDAFPEIGIDFNCVTMSDNILGAGNINVLQGCDTPFEAANAIAEYLVEIYIGDLNGIGGGLGGGGGEAGVVGSSGGGSGMAIVPLVLDLNGDGVELIDLQESEAYFDLKNNQFATQTSWVSSADGLLAMDSNNNGIIDNISELFGSANQTGFSELAELDSNFDGVVNSSDVSFSDLKVWKDSNGDGLTQTGELKSLNDYGIAGFSLTNTAVGTGSITHVGEFIYSDGSTSTLAEVQLLTNPTYSKYTGEVTIPSDVAAIGNIKGYGLMPDLHIAMCLDESLKTTVLAALAGLTIQNINQVFEQILYKWAGVETITLQEIDPGAELAVDPVTGLVCFQNAGCSFTLQQLGVIKQYSGLEVLNVKDGQWRVQQGDIQTTGAYYEKAWNSIYNNLLVKFAVNNGLVENLLPGASYNAVTDMLSVDFDLALTAHDVFEGWINNIFQNLQDITVANQVMLATMVLFEINPSLRKQFELQFESRITAANILEVNQMMETEYYQLVRVARHCPAKRREIHDCRQDRGRPYFASQPRF